MSAARGCEGDGQGGVVVGDGAGYRHPARRSGELDGRRGHCRSVQWLGDLGGGRDGDADSCRAVRRCHRDHCRRGRVGGGCGGECGGCGGGEVVAGEVGDAGGSSDDLELVGGVGGERGRGCEGDGQGGVVVGDGAGYRHPARRSGELDSRRGHCRSVQWLGDLGGGRDGDADSCRAVRRCHRDHCRRGRIRSTGEFGVGPVGVVVAVAVAVVGDDEAQVVDAGDVDIDGGGG